MNYPPKDYKTNLSLFSDQIQKSINGVYESKEHIKLHADKMDLKDLEKLIREYNEFAIQYKDDIDNLDTFTFAITNRNKCIEEYQNKKQLFENSLKLPADDVIPEIIIL